jgi:hypothetical protein
MDAEVGSEIEALEYVCALNPTTDDAAAGPPLSCENCQAPSCRFGSTAELLSHRISRFVGDVPSDEIGRRFIARMLRLSGWGGAKL